MAAVAQRYLQPAIFRRVCRDILELETCDVREMNDNDNEARHEYVSEVTDDLRRVLDDDLPTTRDEQDALLEQVFSLLYDGARSDYEINVGEFDAQLTLLDILQHIETAIEVREYRDFNESGPIISEAGAARITAAKQFINELRSLLVFMGADPEDRDSEEDQVLYHVFLGLRDRLFSWYSNNSNNFNTVRNVGNISVARNSMDPISQNKFEEGENVVRIQANNRFVFKRPGLQTWFQIARTNPLTREDVNMSRVEKGKAKLVGGRKSRRGRRKSRRGRRKSRRGRRKSRRN